MCAHEQWQRRNDSMERHQATEFFFLSLVLLHSIESVLGVYRKLLIYRNKMVILPEQIVSENTFACNPAKPTYYEFETRNLKAINSEFNGIAPDTESSSVACTRPSVPMR